MFNPSEHMMTLKGKDYLQVAWRLVWLRDGENGKPLYGISTEMLEHGEGWAVFKATITNEEGRILSTGHGSESKRDFGDYLEKAETKAVGRALAMLGFGTQFAADELDEGERIVDSPIDRKPTRETFAAARAKEEAEAVICEECGRPIKDSKKTDGSVWPAADIVAYTRRGFGRPLCAECGKIAAANEKKVRR